MNAGESAVGRWSPTIRAGETGSRGKGVDKYDMTDDAGRVGTRRSRAPRDRMDMSLRVVMDGWAR